MIHRPNRREGRCIEGQDYPMWCVVSRRPKLDGPIYFYPMYCTRRGRPWCPVTVLEQNNYTRLELLTFESAKEVAILQSVDAFNNGHTGQ